MNKIYGIKITIEKAMASDENVNNSYFSQYVNFDQFLMQHNIGNSFSPFNQQTSATLSGSNGHHTNNRSDMMQNNNNSNNNNTQWQNGAGSGFDQHREPSRVLNSNLVATAAEFVPRTNRSSTSANAETFTPRNQQKVSTENNRNNEPNRNRGRREPNGPTTAATDSLTNALSNARISEDGNNELKSSGGAIKKVRGQNQRNGSRERHDGECKIHLLNNETHSNLLL